MTRFRYISSSSSSTLIANILFSPNRFWFCDCGEKERPKSVLSIINRNVCFSSRVGVECIKTDRWANCWVPTTFTTNIPTFRRRHRRRPWYYFLFLLSVLQQLQLGYIATLTQLWNLLFNNRPHMWGGYVRGRKCTYTAWNWYIHTSQDCCFKNKKPSIFNFLYSFSSQQPFSHAKNSFSPFLRTAVSSSGALLLLLTMMRI